MHKEKFIKYCKGKIKDISECMTIDGTNYEVIMHSDGVRQFSDVRVIRPLEEYDEGTFIVINSKNKIVINTNMIDYIWYATRMEFDEIDTDFYNEILEYWEDGAFDDYFEE